MPVALYNAGLAKKTSVDSTEFATEIYYYEEGQKIQLKNSLGDVISEIDASRFVVDGMIEGVEIVDDNLVIHFNTDAGKEDITIPISDIFDADNYYTKSATDDAISDAIDDLHLGDAAYRNATDDIVVDHEAYSNQDLVSTGALLNFMLDEGYVNTEVVIDLVREMTSDQPVTISRYEGDRNPISFTLNQRSVYNGNLGLADGAFKSVDTSIGASSSSNLPTSDAVKGYIQNQNFATVSQLPTVNNATVSIARNASDQNPCTFTMNQSAPASFDLGLADGAFKAVDTAISSQSSSNVPTSDAVKSYVNGQGYATIGQLPQVGNGTITIKKNAGDTTNPFNFSVNQTASDELNLGLGAAAEKNVDTAITQNASSNLPTSDAVKGYAYSKAEIDSSYIVSAVFDAINNTLTLVRGDGTTLVVQF